MMKMLEGQQIGPYRLNKFLGAGGFGGVFHASEMVRNTSVQEVAIKVIPESSDDKKLTRCDRWIQQPALPLPADLPLPHPR